MASSIANCSSLDLNAILTQNNTVGPNWRTPTNILQGRLIKFGAQFDF